MHKQLRRALLSIGMLFLLVACSNGPTEGGSSPGTTSGGPVSIATNHSTYQSSDHIQVTVTNGLTTPIYALDTKASCSILTLQTQNNGTWVLSNAAPCPLGRRPAQVKINPGQKYTVTISAGVPGSTQGTFPAGTYRLVLIYSTSATNTSASGSMSTTYSQTFQMMG
jgi:hypothetical protein